MPQSHRWRSTKLQWFLHDWGHSPWKQSSIFYGLWEMPSVCDSLTPSQTNKPYGWLTAWNIYLLYPFTVWRTICAVTYAGRRRVNNDCTSATQSWFQHSGGERDRLQLLRKKNKRRFSSHNTAECMVRLMPKMIRLKTANPMLCLCH